ncbi:hypothetical protein A9O67_02830 [Tepidimonas fonticaldi]|uniref:DUF294 domain-containing protein n=1 Tax=Tepidimonas fonticaldi TaxID=1101373 RepID=A0A1A6DWB0_9BURK|nr:putative nucleotidyltransferase substrate binding domain-containing protein [Tepidimonas fonticaldi]OBS31138.1 hypothetical protein A9O67_02830 [Tepidimonas fonticaldi]
MPVLQDGRVVNVISERDLFALQRLSIKHLGSAIAHGRTLADFQRVAADIRAYARHLMAQGVQARQLTALISRLNDQLTQGLPATGTRERLLTAGRAMGAPAPEVEGWVAAFDFLQTLRLTRQSDSSADPQQPNRIDLNTLNPVDERVLKASLRAIKTLQQRLQLDYLR